MLLRGHETELVTLPYDGGIFTGRAVDDFWDEVDGDEDNYDENFLLDSREGQRDPDHWICNDKEGTMFRPCDVFLVRVREVNSPSCTEQDIQEAASYYRKSSFNHFYRPILPAGSWDRLRDVTAVRYLRGGTGRWRHIFKQPVRCYQATNRALKLSLPGGCVLTDHGFEYP